MGQPKGSDGRDRALDVATTNLKKRYGEGAIMKLGEAADMRVEAIPTGALSLDLALGVEHDIIQKRGAFYGYGDIRLGQGRENAKTFLQENDQLFATVSDEIRRTSALPSRPATIAAPGAG